MSKMEYFAKIVNYFRKHSILDTLPGSEYSSVLPAPLFHSKARSLCPEMFCKIAAKCSEKILKNHRNVLKRESFLSEATKICKLYLKK